ncbi:MAG: DUF4290 domain-containing protein [Bacteroidales bacterium]|nr:DUF4290 domain-containing protein [Bacteroidales bacterium]
MEYNTERNKLIISEYGRNVQKLVNYAITIEDREKRTKFAKVIIQIMGQMNPGIRDTGDFRHKLWDHLHIISDFRLDVDAPYNTPTESMLASKPDKLDYNKNTIRYKMYGSNIVKIITKASDFEEGKEKDALVHGIANHLKKSYLNWNRESVDDELIFEHLKVLSKDNLALKDELKLSSTNEILARNKKKKPAPTGKSSKFQYKKKQKGSYQKRSR